MIWNSIGSMTYLACQWFTTIFVVRLSSGYDDAGLLSLAMSVVGIFGTFANYKMELTVILTSVARTRWASTWDFAASRLRVRSSPA